MKIKKLLVSVVLDESGSMQLISEKTRSGFNEYITSLYPQGKACHMTITKFGGDRVNTLCNDVPVKDAPLLSDANYDPSGGTPLLDAVGKIITDITEKQKVSKEGQDVLFVVITDGEENASVQYTHKQIMDLISEKEKSGWTFVYLGANQDSWGNASKIGYSNVGNVTNFQASPSGMCMAMSGLSQSTGDYIKSRSTYYETSAPKDVSGNLLKCGSYSTDSFWSESIVDEDKIFKKGGKKNAKSK